MLELVQACVAGGHFRQVELERRVKAAPPTSKREALRGLRGEGPRQGFVHSAALSEAAVERR
jgi:hypothetical protein